MTCRVPDQFRPGIRRPGTLAEEAPIPQTPKLLMRASRAEIRFEISSDLDSVHQKVTIDQGQMTLDPDVVRMG